MKTSSKGIELLSKLEGIRLMPYDDQTGKVIDKWCKGATIGIGYLIPENEWDIYRNGIDLNKAYELLEKKLSEFESVVEKYCPVLQQTKFDALVILCYNIGSGNFISSSVVKMITKKGSSNYKTLRDAWLAWDKSQGKIMEGLHKRRIVEYGLYDSGVYL